MIQRDQIALLFPDLCDLRTKDFIYQVQKAEFFSQESMSLTKTERSAHVVDL